jgi:hypothetical protein
VRRSGLAVAAVGLGLATGAGSKPASADPMSTTPELAYDMGEPPGARAIGMGGALNALGVSTTALALNPANMTMARVYHLEALAALSPEAGRQTYGLAVVDSVLNSSRLAGGLLGTWSEMDPDGMHRIWTDVRGGLALPLGDHLSLGATGRWLRVQQDAGAGPFGSDAVSGGTSGGPVLNAFTFDAGATGAIGDAFRIGVVGHNLTNLGTALAPTTGALGVGYGTHEFALEADGLLDFTTYSAVRGRLMVGGELFVADRYAIRAGWRYDGGNNVNSPSVGLGYIDPHFGIEVAVRHDLVAQHASTFGVLALRYFYDTTGAATPADAPDAF